MTDRLRLGACLICLLVALAAGCTNAEGLTTTKRDWAKANGLEGRVLWMDATANLERLSTRGGVARILDKCVKANLNAVAVGVKTPCGFSLYNSRAVPRMTTFMGRFDYPTGYDLLQTTIEEGHRRGLRVYALLQVFSEGRISNKTGPGYTEFPEWQTWVYDINAEGKPAVMPIAEWGNGDLLFANPALPQVQRYELRVVRELATKYEIDGIVYDRCRYRGDNADFSRESRIAFEAYIGKKLARFPEDIIEIRVVNGLKSVTQGPYYKKWIEWRASVIGDFVRKSAAQLKKDRSGASFGSVVGAWYPAYAGEGANWASTKFDPYGKYPWAGWISQDYHETGYAESLDCLIPNCYGKIVTLEEGSKTGTAAWWTVEGQCDMANAAVDDACWVYGGVYLAQYEGDPEEFRRAVEMAVRKTNGIKVFDLSQLEDYGWWGILEQVFAKPASGIPHEDAMK